MGSAYVLKNRNTRLRIDRLILPKTDYLIGALDIITKPVDYSANRRGIEKAHRGSHNFVEQSGVYCG